MTLKLSRVAALAALFAFALTPVARASDPVAFEFTAQVTDIPVDNGDLPINLMGGSVISGFYVFDADTVAAPQGPGSGTGDYPGAMRYFARVDLLGTSFTALAPVGHPAPLLYVRSHDADLDPIEEESYRAEMAGVDGDLTNFQIVMTEALTPSAIVGTELAVVPPDPASFMNAQMGITTQDGSQVIADVLTLPEPASAGGAAAAGLALAALARRRRHTA